MQINSLNSLENLSDEMFGEAFLQMVETNSSFWTVWEEVELLDGNFGVLHITSFANGEGNAMLTLTNATIIEDNMEDFLYQTLISAPVYNPFLAAVLAS